MVCLACGLSAPLISGASFQAAVCLHAHASPAPSWHAALGVACELDTFGGWTGPPLQPWIVEHSGGRVVVPAAPKRRGHRVVHASSRAAMVDIEERVRLLDEQLSQLRGQASHLAGRVPEALTPPPGLPPPGLGSSLGSCQSVGRVSEALTPPPGLPPPGLGLGRSGGDGDSVGEVDPWCARPLRKTPPPSMRPAPAPPRRLLALGGADSGRCAAAA